MANGPVSLESIVSPFVSMLIYGKPGVGKTVFGGGSQVFRTFIFDVDKGTLSLASSKTSQRLTANGYPPIHKELIKAWPVSTYSDFEEGLRWFIANEKQFDLVLIDTGTELQRMLVDEIMRKNKHVIPDQRDWGMALTSMEYLTRTLRDMRKHVIMLAHETYSTDQQTLITTHYPNFKGQFAKDYAKHFSVIARYMMIDQQIRNPDGTMASQTLRFLNCHPDPMSDAKDRSSSLEKYELPILDNVMSKILSAIQG